MDNSKWNTYIFLLLCTMLLVGAGIIVILAINGWLILSVLVLLFLVIAIVVIGLEKKKYAGLMLQNQELRDSERNLKEAQVMAQLGYWLWDVKTGDVQWSENVYKIFNQDPMTFKPQIDSILALSPWPEDHNRGNELIQKAIENHETGSYEQRFLKPDGSIGYYISTFQGIYDENDELILMKGTVQDITERKKAEEELRCLRNYLANIINSMPSVLVSVNAEGLVSQWNSTAVENTGISSEQAVGKELIKLMPRLEPIWSTISESIHTGEIKKESKKPYQTADKIIYEDLTIYPLTTNGVEEAVIRIDDVTREHDLEQQLSHSRKMDAIGQLAGGVAHDFNNMLAGIMGASELLKNPKRALDEKGISYVELISKAVSRASDLTSKLLAFGRKGKLASTVIDLYDVVKDTLAILERTLDKRITISVSKNAENSRVVGDNSGLQNALMNLCINSSHAMPAGGEIQIEINNIFLDEMYCRKSPFELTSGEYVELIVRDEGCGIAPEDQQKVFEPFFTTKEEGEGTGLGLAAVYGTVKDHHGAIVLYSERGEGTVFHIYLPSYGGATAVKHEEVEVCIGSGTVLLVDDEDIICVTGQHMLEELGYKVLLAKNGVEAVELYQKLHQDIDLIILDMIMPVMNGREAFKKLKAINNECNIIISSGFAKDENLQEIKQDDHTRYIRKPFSEYELSKALAKALNRK